MNKKTLLEHLVNYGWDEEIAADICAAYQESMVKVRKYARSLGDKEHDYVDEIVGNIKDWEKS
jgi:hypothetical protein